MTDQAINQGMTNQPMLWPRVDDEIVSHLPPVLRAIVKALGFGHANDFLKNYGGRPWILPKHKTSKHGLDAEDLARLRITLKSHVDTEGRLTLPKNDKLFAYMRNKEIFKKRESESIQKQAIIYHLTTRQIINIRSKASKAERLQPSQFRRSLTLDKTELHALLQLTIKAAMDKSTSPIYTRLLNKLGRAVSKSTTEEDSSFSLF